MDSPQATFSNCLFTDNFARYRGGGVYSADSNLTLIDCVFAGNSPGEGAGLSSYGDPTLINCAFIGNAGYGGAMYSKGDPVLIDCAFLENTAYSSGLNVNSGYALVVGCSFIGNSGYRGRMGIFELMLMSSHIRELAFNEAPTGEIRQAAVNEGMKTLYQDGITKVLRGITTVEEVLRVSKQSESQ